MLIIIVDIKYQSLSFKNTLAIHLFYVNEGKRRRGQILKQTLSMCINKKYCEQV